MSKGPEAKLWSYVEKRVRGEATHFTRVESHATAVGVPDTNYCIYGKEGWVELKAENSKGQIILRKSQYAWMRDRIKAGATRIYILWVADVEYTDERGPTKVYGLVWCDDATKVRELLRCTKPVEWFSHSIVTWENSIDFDELRKELMR